MDESWLEKEPQQELAGWLVQTKATPLRVFKMSLGLGCILQVRLVDRGRPACHDERALYLAEESCITVIYDRE